MSKTEEKVHSNGGIVLGKTTIERHADGSSTTREFVKTGETLLGQEFKQVSKTKTT